MKLKIFEKFDLNGTELKNRIVMAPMGRSRANEETHTVSALHEEYYGQRASAGLIITEGALVSETANGGINLPGIYNTEQINSWKKVTDRVHNEGGKIFLQLWHTGRLSHPRFLKGSLPKGPSVLPFQSQVYTEKGFEDVPLGTELTIEEIQDIVKDFGNAASNAIDAGFDGVEIQAGNGYLVQQFINSYSNNRTDDYGGSKEKRIRFLREILEDISNRIPLWKVGIRLNPSQHNILGMNLIEDTIETHEYLIKELNEYNLAYLHLTEPFTDVTNEKFAVQSVTEHFSGLYNGIIIANGNFDNESAIDTIESEKASLISFGKLFIANPDLVERFKYNWPLNKLDEKHIYSGGETGYTDYPFYQQKEDKLD